MLSFNLSSNIISLSCFAIVIHKHFLLFMQCVTDIWSMNPSIYTHMKQWSSKSTCASSFYQHTADDLCRHFPIKMMNLCLIIPPSGTPSPSLPEGFILQLKDVQKNPLLCYNKCFTMESEVGFIKSLTCYVVG